MGQILKIIVVLMGCHFLAYFVLSKLTPYRAKLLQYFIACSISIIAAVLTRNILLGYVATFFICLHFGQRATPSEKIGLFFANAFTLSVATGVELNPGIDLGGLSHYKVIVLTLFLPLIIFGGRERGMTRFNIVDKAVILYFAWMILVNFRIPSFTGMMRENFWMAVTEIIPYLCIRFFTRDYALVFVAMSFALLSQVAAGTAEAILKWHIHTDIELLTGYADITGGMYKFRGSFLRVQTSFMNPLIYALFANMAFLCAFVYMLNIEGKGKQYYSKLYAWIGLGVSMLGTLASGSRAGIAGSIIIVAVSIALMWAVNKERDPRRMIVMALICGLGVILVFGQDFFREHFPYRVRLIEVSSSVVMSSPLTGYLDPTQDPRMQVMRQGEGIIDIVNAYVSIALHYGLPALFLFVFIVFSCLSKVYSSLRICDKRMLPFGVFAFCSILILAFNLFTTSAIGWTGTWIWLLLAIGSNIISRTQMEMRKEAPPLI